MPAATRTGKPRGAASRTPAKSASAASTAAPSRSASRLAAKRKTSAEQKAADQQRAETIRARNVALLEDEGDPDEIALEAGHLAPIVTASGDDEEGDDDVLPPSDDEDNALPVASSDPVDFYDSADDVVVSDEVDPFVTPVKNKRRRDLDDDGGDDAPAPKGGKVTKADMTPRLRRFAGEVKSEVVLVTATKNPYPGTLNISRGAIVNNAMVSVIARTSDAEFEHTYARVQRDAVKMQIVTAWVLYARGAFIHQLAVVCRQHVASLGIPGSMTPLQVVDVVTWLLKTESWKFGGLHVLTREFNRSAPFGADFFESVGRTLFMEGRKKQSGETFRYLIELQRLPLVFMALTMTAMEHALTEWRDGTHRRADFKEDAGVRYLYHLSGLELVRDKAPSYIDKLQSSLFKDMLVHTNKTFLLETAVSDALGSLDFSALEKSASD